MINKSIISIKMLDRHLQKNMSPFLLLVLFFLRYHNHFALFKNNDSIYSVSGDKAISSQISAYQSFTGLFE